MSVNIPKIIHQTWKTKDIPEEWKESPRTIKKFQKEKLRVTPRKT